MATWVSIEIEDCFEGTPEEVGLELPEGFTAQDVLDDMKRDSRGDKFKMLKDWNLLDEPTIRITVSRHEAGGTSTVEW